KRAYCLKTQPATGETYPKSDLFNKASIYLKKWQSKYYHQIQIKKKTNNNHNQVVHNITSL
ncbi:hypothetical protein LNT74_27140, partial [Klebsiella pneumoniae]|nr:hypothetical protein [Klebsiella pneumoniae]MCJ5481228.1 hypothetical protein [Klebsiella pneumoniae]